MRVTSEVMLGRLKLAVSVAVSLRVKERSSTIKFCVSVTSPVFLSIANVLFSSPLTILKTGGPEHMSLSMVLSEGTTTVPTDACSSNLLT